VIQFRIRVVPIEVVNVLTVRSRLFWFLFLCEASRRAEMWLFELRMEVRSLATSLSFFFDGRYRAKLLRRSNKKPAEI